MRTIHVRTQQPYDVVIGVGALDRLPEALGGASQAAVIFSSALAVAAREVARRCEAAGVRPCLVEVPVGEAAKTTGTLDACWRALARADFTRSDVVIGVGGGATTDLAGFVAATFLRGCAWIAVPTSVLGLVDAAVGGKTGADLPEGKNLIGAFWEPRAVLADLDLLAGLPADEVSSGLVEAVKMGFTSDRRIVSSVLDDPAEALDVTSERFLDVVARAVRVKAAAVSDDLREKTSQVGGQIGREVLNYGHTLAHAIETHEGYTWRHGVAVGVGMVYAAELARLTLRLSEATVDLHRQVLTALGLPTAYDGATFEEVRALMARDKKTRGAHLRFVLLRAFGEPTIFPDPPEDALRAAYAAIAPW
ncbi:MAG: 3-dehydroquinate synthase [Actinomycetia bacterium]|nr:3-dehydroquinate synthase [Actinomycetes bacterium]